MARKERTSKEQRNVGVTAFMPSGNYSMVRRETKHWYRLLMIFSALTYQNMLNRRVEGRQKIEKRVKEKSSVLEMLCIKEQNCVTCISMRLLASFERTCALPECVRSHFSLRIALIGQLKAWIVSLPSYGVYRFLWLKLTYRFSSEEIKNIRDRHKSPMPCLQVLPVWLDYVLTDNKNNIVVGWRH